jgi:hypothetical protein
VAMFFLMRYQTVVASRREINLARQFCRVSLARRTESNVERQFFEARLFIIPVQQNFGDSPNCGSAEESFVHKVTQNSYP